MKLNLPNAFLSTGKAALSSYLLSLRNYVENFHDHSAEGTQIALAQMPTGLGNAKIKNRQLTLSHAAPTFLSSQAAGNLAVAASMLDPDLTLTHNVAYDAFSIIYVAARYQDAGTNTVIVRVDGQDQPLLHKVKTQPITIAVPLLLGNASHTIRVYYSVTGAGTVYGPRRLEAMIFKAVP